MYLLIDLFTFLPDYIVIDGFRTDGLSRILTSVSRELDKLFKTERSPRNELAAANWLRLLLLELLLFSTIWNFPPRGAFRRRIDTRN